MKKVPKWFYFINIGKYPLEVVFAPNARAFRRALNFFNVKDLPEKGFYPKSGGCVSIYYPHQRVKGTTPICIITIDLNLKVSKEQIAAIVAHEAVHVFQYLTKIIEEDDPCWEFEAYTVQGIVQDVLYSIKRYKSLLRRIK